MPRSSQLDRDQLFQQIIEALNQMPDLMRQVFILSHYQEVSPDDIASKIGVKKEEIPFLLKCAEDLLYQKLQPTLIPPTKTMKLVNFRG